MSIIRRLKWWIGEEEECKDDILVGVYQSGCVKNINMSSVNVSTKTPCVPTKVVDVGITYHKNGWLVSSVTCGNRMITISKRSKTVRCFYLVTYIQTAHEEWHPCRPTRDIKLHRLGWRRVLDEDYNFMDIPELVTGKINPPQKLRYRWKHQETQG